MLQFFTRNRLHVSCKIHSSPSPPRKITHLAQFLTQSLIQMPKNKEYVQRFRNDTVSTIRTRCTEDRFPEQEFLRVIPSCNEIKIFRWAKRDVREQREKERQGKGRGGQSNRVHVFFFFAINLITATIVENGVAPPIISLQNQSREPLRNSSLLRGYRIIFPCPSAVLAGFGGGLALWRPVITENFFLLLCRWSRARKKRREQRTRACDSPWQKNGESALNFARPCNRWASLSLSVVQRRDWWKCRGFLARGGDLPGSGKNIPEREKLI